jgi:cation diffusion facilitator family transporter
LFHESSAFFTSRVVYNTPMTQPHSHIFLGENHAASEKRTWAVIWLCGFMMVAEIGGGWLFGSIALVADGLHMSTHAGAMLLAALAYGYARRHAADPRFSFGTGKLGDLAGFSSAIILAMISLLIAYDAVTRLFAPVAIHFAEAIPIATLGLVVNIASAWLLAGGHHHHGHGHDHHHDETHALPGGLRLEIFEDGVPPVFRLHGAAAGQITTIRPDGTRQNFAMRPAIGYLESAEEIPEPHAFTVEVAAGGATQRVEFAEHAHEKAGRDNNMRAAIVHIIADAAVSVLVIAGLVLAKLFGWLWMDPLAGLIGAVVIASWAYGLVRDTGAILLDMCPDARLESSLRNTIEAEGDEILDLHLWRLGPGHLGAILSVATAQPRSPAFYKSRLAGFKMLSHLTVEILPLSNTTTLSTFSE